MPYKHWTDEEVNKIRARKLHFSIQEIADNKTFDLLIKKDIGKIL